MNSFHSFKVTIQQQSIMLFPLFLKDAITFGLYVYFFGFSLNFGSWNYIIIGYVLVDIILTLLVHLQYLVHDSKSQVVIDEENRTLSIKTEHNIQTLTLTDILNVDYIYSFCKGTGWYGFGDYRYYKLYVRGGEELIITCLLMNKIEEKLKSLIAVDPYKKGRIVAFIY